MVLMFVLAQLFIGVWKTFAIYYVEQAFVYPLAVIKYTLITNNYEQHGNKFLSKGSPNHEVSRLHCIWNSL